MKFFSMFYCFRCLGTPVLNPLLFRLNPLFDRAPAFLSPPTLLMHISCSLSHCLFVTRYLCSTKNLPETTMHLPTKINTSEQWRAHVLTPHDHWAGLSINLIPGGVGGWGGGGGQEKETSPGNEIVNLLYY